MRAGVVSQIALLAVARRDGLLGVVACFDNLDRRHGFYHMVHGGGPPTTAERPRLSILGVAEGEVGAAHAAAATLALPRRTSAHCSVVELPVTEVKLRVAQLVEEALKANARAPR